MRIRYFYKNKKGKAIQNELTIEQIEDGDKKKFENTLSVDYELELRIVVFNMNMEDK